MSEASHNSHFVPAWTHALLIAVLLAAGCSERPGHPTVVFEPVGKSHPYILTDTDTLTGISARADTVPLRGVRRRALLSGDWAMGLTFEDLRDLPLFTRVFRWRAVMHGLWSASFLSGDDRYREHMYSLVGGLYRSEDMGLEYFKEEHPVGGFAAALAVVYDLDREKMDENTRSMFEDMLRAYGEDLYERSFDEAFGEDEDCRYAWNHAAIAYSGMGLAALALGNPDEETADWLGRAYDGVTEYVEHGLADDGVGREGLFYTGYTMSSAAYFLLGMHNAYEDKTVTDPRIARMLEWYAYETLPMGGLLNNRNDSNMRSEGALGGYLALASLHDNPAAAWTIERLAGGEGAGLHAPVLDALLFYPGEADPGPGLPESRYFEESGLLVSRTGWGVDDAMFTFTSGPFIGCIHDQSDENSFTLAAYGMQMVIDSGSANSTEEGSASQSVGHNSVLVGGRGMAISGGGMGTDGHIPACSITGDADFVLGDAKAAYVRDSHNPVERAFRYACFVKGPRPYLVTYDDILRTGGGTNLYEYLLHLDPSLGPVPEEGGRYVYEDPATGAGLAVRFAHPEELMHRSTRFINKNADARIADHPLERFTVEAVEPGIVCVLVPYGNGVPPDFSVRTYLEDGARRVRVRFADTGREDTIGFGPYTEGGTVEGVFTFTRTPDGASAAGQKN